MTSHHRVCGSDLNIPHQFVTLCQYGYGLKIMKRLTYQVYLALAPFCPTFFRSLVLTSRVSNPAVKRLSIKASVKLQSIGFVCVDVRTKSHSLPFLAGDEAGEGESDAVPDGTCLSRRPNADNLHLDVDFVKEAGELQREHQLLSGRKISLESLQPSKTKTFGPTSASNKPKTITSAHQ